MKPRHFLLVLKLCIICAFILSSCSVTNNEKESDVENNIVQQINRDNVIYINGREFVFSYKYYSKQNKPMTCYVLDTTKMLWKLEEKIQNPNNKWYAIDKIHLRVHYKTKDSVSTNQTPIEYSYFSNNKRIGFKEQTSISESDNMVMINVPRFYCFYLSELISPPLINRPPLKIGESWPSSIEIPESTIKFMRLDTLLKTNGNIVNGYSTTITDTISIETNMGKLFCYVVNTESKNNNKLPSLISYFNEKYGFIRLNYFNIDSTRMEYNLEAVIDK
jgi:hypothetical protein